MTEHAHSWKDIAGCVSCAVLGETIIDLGRISLDFGRVERVTFHQNGLTPETDTTHTVMLGLIASALAAKLYPDRLNVGRVAQFALVHDLVEAYCGDTPTLFATPEQLADKRAREAKAMQRIVVEYESTLPWVVETLREYEAQIDVHARFVRAADKILPKITHALNGGVTITATGKGPDDLDAEHRQQLEDIRGYAGEFTELLNLYMVLSVRAGAALTERLAEEASTPPDRDPCGTSELLPRTGLETPR